jgi:hypothetical protein
MPEANAVEMGSARERRDVGALRDSLGRAGPYAAAPRSEGLLAERGRGFVSQEHPAWGSHREPLARRFGDAR